MKISGRVSHVLFATVTLALTLGAIAQPTISTQPSSQSEAIGGSFTLSVAATVPEGTPVLPTVTSGTLRAWLKADAGVVTNSSGLVSLWHDQSGNGFDVSQTNSPQAPLLTTATMAGGSRPVLRFNGPSAPVDGDYLYGSADLELTNGYTSFFLISCSDVTGSATAPTMIGSYSDYHSVRASYVQGGQLGFSAWSDDYLSALTIGQNSHRIWTDRLANDLSDNDIFDYDGTNTTSASQAVTGLGAPLAGYYIGGLNDTTRSFPGDFSEVLYYKGALSDADRLAVTAYLQEKYYAVGTTNGITYQWQFDGANIAGATNATLALADVQSTNAGTYTVVVTGSTNSVTSSNAVLTVGLAPSITSQPQSQEAIQGTNVSFSVSASGSGSLAYQWYLNGNALSGATNSGFTLTNLSGPNAGNYNVLVSSPFGSVSSSNALLTVDLFPVIGEEPQSQDAPVGGSVTLTALNNLPAVSSGALRLWLRSDAGVVANDGLVSLWHDQSGNGFDATQSTNSLEPTLISAALPGGDHPALSFNGLSPEIGDFLHGTNDLGLSNGYTSFFVYSSQDDGTRAVAFTMVGQYSAYDSVRTSYIYHGNLGFSAWANDYLSSVSIVSNTFRIWTDRLSDNLSTNEIFDYDGTNTAYADQPVGNLGRPGPGYYIAGLGDPTRSTACQICEVLYYSGGLNEADRRAVTTYLQQKYYDPGYNGAGGSDVTYQWQFDGTNIAGATNGSLTLTNIQPSQAGTYTVVATNLAGTTISSNAVLTVGYAPGFNVQPQSQFVAAGGAATFTASATGTGPLSYQWSFDGSIVNGATNSSLSLSNIPTSVAGTYAVTVSSPFGSAVSSNAALSVLVPTLQVGHSSISGGATITVPIQLVAVGTEAAVGFSLNYDPSVLTFTGAQLGSNAIGSLLLVNSNQVAAGQLGLAVDLTGELSLGTNDLVNVSFQVAVLTNAQTTTITFGGQPTAEEISDSHGTPLFAQYLPGSISISKAVLEGDVWPFPNGDGLVTISDWVEEGRLVAGLDTTTNAGELSRADCAPRDTGGDGELTVADWVQVGRYAAGLDPLTAVGNPPGETSVRLAPIKTSAPRAISIVPLTQGGLTNAVAVQLAAQGGENSLGFSVSFDPAAVRFVNATLGSGATGAVLFQNTDNAASGQLGFLIGYNLSATPTSFTVGLQQVLRLNFASVSYSNNVALNFNNAPVTCQLVDINADSLAAIYQNGVLPIAGAAWPALRANISGGSQISLSWPVTGGFVIESAPSIAGPWTPITPTSTNGANAVLAAPTTSGQAFYRLQQQQ